MSVSWSKTVPAPARRRAVSLLAGRRQRQLVLVLGVLDLGAADQVLHLGLADRPALILGMSSLRLFRRVEIDFANREIAFSLPKPPIDFGSACRSFSNCVVF